MFLFGAASNMEIKVGIRVKVLVSPLPLSVGLLLPGGPLPSSFSLFFLSLSGSSLQPFLFFSCSLIPSLFPSFSLFLPHFGFYFGSVGTDTAAGDHLDNLLSSFSSSSLSSSPSPSSTAVAILFFFIRARKTTFGRAVPQQDVIFATL